MLCAAGLGGSWNLPIQAATVVAWGNNSLRQCDVPVGLTNVVAITAGNSQNLALKADGTVVGWGRGVPVLTNAPAGLTNLIAVSLGGSNAVALKADGSVVGWGPIPMPAGLTNMVAVGSGYRTSLALQPNGDLYGWWVQGSVALVQTNVVAASQSSIAAGYTHSLALHRDGTVVAWGDNSRNQCNVPADLTNAVAVVGGSGYSLALRADGSITGWGTALPTLPAGLTNVLAISGAGNFGLALKSDGTVVAWGSGVVPTTVPAGLTNVVAIAAGSSHALALVGEAPPVLTAVVGNLKWSTNNLSLSLPTQNGRVYGLDYKESLADPDWKTLPMAAGLGSTQALSDLTATNHSRIYRVRQW